MGKVDSFIGETFDTPQGGVLTVVGVLPKVKGKHLKYQITCSVCSEDKELYPDLFESTKGNLVSGKVPCGCAKIPKLTDRQETIIINRHLKENATHLTVVGVSDRKSGRHKVYTLSCSVCSEDKELYPDLFESVKGSLVNGQIPCGCAKSSKWTKQQYEVRVKRECIKRGYEFLGFVGNPDKVNAKTKLSLRCLVDGDEWQSTNIANFFCGKGCPECRITATKEANTKPDSALIQSFMATGAYPEGTTFTRNTTRKNKAGHIAYWDVFCPICSNDEFVSNELCSGIFVSYAGNLQRGNKPCRCNTHSYQWTQAQIEYRIQKVCDSEGLGFKGFTDKGYTGTNKSKHLWTCSKGHLCDSTTVHSFLNNDIRCKTCRDESGIGNGFYPDRTEEQDYLYIISFDNQYIKVGRSFDVIQRMVGLSKDSGIPEDKLEILSIYTATHQEIYDVEQELHMELEERGFYHHDSVWTTETFDTDCEDILFMLLDRSGLKEGQW